MCFFTQKIFLFSKAMAMGIFNGVCGHDSQVKSLSAGSPHSSSVIFCFFY